MSVWADIHRRANGVQERKENLVLDPLDSLYKSVNTDIMVEIEKIRHSSIQLRDRISDLKKELDSFRWVKKPIYKNCKR